MRNTWTKITFQQPEKSRDQKSNQSGLDIFLQIQTRAHIKILLLTTQTPLIQRCDHADAELRLWHLDTIQGTWKNDTIDSTQNASPHRPNKEKIQKENSAQQERRRWTKTESEPQNLRWRNCRRYQFKHRLRPRQPHFIHEWHRRIFWHKRNWRGRLGWIHEVQHSCGSWKDESSQNPMLDWNTHRRMKWRLAMRLASLPDERRAKKAATWNHDLSTKIKTCRSVRRL